MFFLPDYMHTTEHMHKSYQAHFSFLLTKLISMEYSCNIFINSLNWCQEWLWTLSVFFHSYVVVVVFCVFVHYLFSLPFVLSLDACSLALTVSPSSESPALVNDETSVGSNESVSSQSSNSSGTPPEKSKNHRATISTSLLDSTGYVAKTRLSPKHMS